MRLLANGSVVQIPGWSEITWLRHGFSTRRGGVSTVYLDNAAGDVEGDLNTGWTSTDDPALVAENRRRLVASVGGGSAALVTLRQVHSSTSLVVPQQTAAFFSGEGRAALEADGLMTTVSDVLLGIQTADCVPVLVVDTRLRVAAGFHAGWRGTAAGIVQQGIAQMSAEFGSQPLDLLAAVGPSIGNCCYSVGGEVREAFTDRFAYASKLFEVRRDQLQGKLEDKLYLDLWEANRRQLVDAGLPTGGISVVGECSGCAGLPERRKYFSHRCENGFTGRMMSVVGISEG